MKTTRVMLSVPEPMLAKLSEVQKEYCYPSMQQTILQILRDSLFTQKDALSEGTKKGRPKKMDENRIMAKTRIFDRKGKSITV